MARVRNRRVGFILARSSFENGGQDALARTRLDRFAAVQPCVETSAQRGQVERGGAVPVAMAGSEG